MDRHLKYIEGEIGRVLLRKETYNKLVNIKTHKDNFLYYYRFYYAVRIIAMLNNYQALLL